MCVNGCPRMSNTVSDRCGMMAVMPTGIAWEGVGEADQYRYRLIHQPHGLFNAEVQQPDESWLAIEKTEDPEAYLWDLVTALGRAVSANG